MNGLIGYHNLKALWLKRNKIGKNGCVALGNFLKNPLMRLEELDLRSCGIDDECLHVLSQGFSVSNTMKKLNLCENKAIGSRGLESLTSAFKSRSFKLEELSLHYEEGRDAALLKSMFASATNLTKVRFSASENSQRCFGAVFTLLQNSSLESLDLSKSRLADKSLKLLGQALANSNLKLLDLSNNFRTITARAWVTFFELLRNCDLELEKLDLGQNMISDRGAAVLSTVLANKKKLRSLSLRNNSWITLRGFIAISDILRNPSSALIKLCVEGRLLDDEMLTVFSDAISNNTCLRALKMDGHAISITNRGWAVLSNCLCNNSSIDATYQSNHTLEEFKSDDDVDIESSDEDDDSWDESRCPYSVRSLFRMNRNPNKFEVARQKIIEYHFLTGNEDDQTFLDMDLIVLPVAIAWMSRDDTVFSLLYEFLRKMPSLFERRQHKILHAKKRKHTESV